KTLFALMQLALHPLARADIARYFRSSDDFSCGVSDGRNCQRYLELRAVFSHAHGVEMLDALALAESRQDSCFLVSAIEGNDHRDRLSYGLLGCVSEKSLGAA